MNLFLMSYLIISHVVVDGAWLSLYLWNHESDLRVIRNLVDHHLDLVVEWFLELNEIWTYWLFSGSRDSALILLWKIENYTYTTLKISYKVPLEAFLSLVDDRTKNHPRTSRETVGKWVWMKPAISAGTREVFALTPSSKIHN